MQFDLQSPVPQSVFIPYLTHKRQYHLLFTKPVKKGDVLSVFETDDISLETYFRIAQLRLGGYSGEHCGYIYFSHQPVMCLGTAILAYSKNWHRAVNEKRVPIIPFGVELVLKDEAFYVYHKINKATLVVSPKLATRIRENLEV